MLEEGIKEYKEEGWELLLAFEDGALFLGEGYKIPEKEEIVDNVLKSFFDRSLGIQPVYSPNFTNRFLGGLSELFPTKFMKIGNHEQVIKDNLGDITKKGVQFFRLLYDLLSLDEREFSKIKKEMLRWELIPSCLGKSGHKKVKEFLWTKHFNEKSPNSINTDVINKLPEKMKVKEVVPKTYEVSEIDFDKYLSKLTPEELFSILYTIAEQKEITETETFKKYLKDTISLEEVKDFKNVAQEIFERYKTYKRTTDAAIGICERCGCPVSIIAGPALKYPKSKTFTQIKSKPTAYKSTCPFCAYDNMILREDLRGNDLRIFVRIESKIPEIIKTYLELDRLVTTLRNGLEYPCQILKLEEREELKDLPFPKRMSIPVAREDYSKAEKLLSTERGTLFGVERLRMEKFSPKDHRVKYEPLYHALNLLGFHTNIGAEEQVGLFGENLITTKSEYYKSLAVIILANVLAKDQNKYIFAKNLLEQSPSVALRFASETQKGTNNPRMQEELAGRFYTFIHKSGIILFRVSGGEYGMKDLLKDAAFFADKDWGIPHFCVEPEDRGDFWRDLTRHKAAKPVSDALNEMLQGNEEGAFQRAIAAFMNNLSKKISGEEKEKQNEFMERTIKILEKFWELRERDISEFIRYKNAFTSTIFVFTRYPNLKEVTK
ncbi:MAG: hypothetical protein QMD22_00785 [archaeon]|nr:hypothetical protein [archaeon]